MPGKGASCSTNLQHETHLAQTQAPVAVADEGAAHCTLAAADRRRLTYQFFHSLCRPPLMRSFIRSYEDATLVKTAPTLPAFSSDATSSYPAGDWLCCRSLFSGERDTQS